MLSVGPKYALFFLLYSTLAIAAATRTRAPSATAATPCLLTKTPAFSLSVDRFQRSFGDRGPDLPLGRFHTVSDDPSGTGLAHTTDGVGRGLCTSATLRHNALGVGDVRVA